MKNIDTVILANGRFPEHEIPLSIIKNAHFIVCCDGAANEFIGRGGTPDAIVGDCDSVSKENKVRFSDILYKNPDQETNDLTKAVHFCIEKEIKDIVIVGGTGKREDHTLGNISLLANYIEKVNVRMITNFGILTPITSTETFHSVKGQQVSVFSLEQKPITTQNLLYSVKDRVLKYWWQGTLNEALGNHFTIETQGTVIVYQLFHSSWKIESAP